MTRAALRAVFDTTVLVSYLLTRRPPIATLIDVHLARAHLVPITAPELLEELNRVLAYPRLQRYYTDEQRTRFIALLMSLSEVVDLPETVPPICRDPDDDRFIACAVAGDADVIVSAGDDLLALEHVGEIPILSAAQFLERIESEAMGE